LDSGWCHIDKNKNYNLPQKNIKAYDEAHFCYRKQSNTACGSVGVLVYKIKKNGVILDKKLAILWSVPYD